MHILNEFTNTIIIEKSKFICYLNKCTNENEYKEYISRIRKKHYDASHVCSALICESCVRSSDDGEPSGTAGKPILNILEKNNMKNTCAIVVRYFGGIKLGAGGLIRAYGDCTKECLSKADKYIEEKYKRYKLKLSFSLSNKIDNYLNNNTIIEKREYNEDVLYIFLSNNDNITNIIKEKTSGIEPLYIEEAIIDKIVK